jgi:hypothetical protein
MKANKLTLTTVVLLLLSFSVWASDKMKANIQIDHTVHVGSTQLAPAGYEITWTENGSNAEVTFLQRKKVIATVPAQITHARSGYDGPALHTDSASSALIGVELPNVSLSFTNENAVAGGAGK